MDTETITLPIPTPEISSNSTRQEILDAIETFNLNKKHIEELTNQNNNNYSNFIEQNRNIIKQITPSKGRVYLVIEKGGWMNSYNRASQHEDAIKYVFIQHFSLKKDTNGNSEYMVRAKATPLDESGKLIKYICHYDKTETVLCEYGDDIFISHLSEQDYPEVLLKYKNHLKNTNNRELKTLERLKLKYDR